MSLISRSVDDVEGVINMDSDVECNNEELREVLENVSNTLGVR